MTVSLTFEEILDAIGDFAEKKTGIKPEEVGIHIHVHVNDSGEMEGKILRADVSDSEGKDGLVQVRTVHSPREHDRL